MGPEDFMLHQSSSKLEQSAYNASAFKPKNHNTLSGCQSACGLLGVLKGIKHMQEDSEVRIERSRGLRALNLLKFVCTRRMCRG
jgi:hypothetical protein